MRLAGGRLAKDAPADLVLIDVAERYVVDPSLLKSRSKNTPFDGKELTGRALRTIVAGESVFVRDETPE